MIIEIEGGKKLEVPDGSTPEQIDEVISHFQSSAPVQETAAPQEKPSLGRTAFDQGMQGATLGFADEITSALAAPVVALATGQSIPESYRQGQELSKEQLANQMDQRPVTSIASNLAGGLLTGGAAASTKAGAAVGNSVRTGLVPGSSLAARAANLFSKAGQGAVIGAASGGLYGAGTANPGERYESAKSGATTGAIIGGALPVAGAAASGAVGAIAPKADEGLVAAGKLAQKYKIPLSVDELTTSKAVKNVQKVSQELPFSGQSGFREKQMRAFNRAITNSFGQNSDRITPDVMDKAFEQVGKEFDSLGRGKTFDMGTGFKTQIDEILQDAPSTYNADALQNFDNELAVIAKNLSPDGTISGEKLSFLRSRLNKLARKTSNPDTRELMHDLENAVIDLMTAGDDAAKEALSDAKYKYKNLLVIEPLAQKAKGGNIAPSQLNNRVAKIYGRAQTRGKAGELGDLARIGNELLPDLAGSDTTQKMLYAGGSLIGLANPLTTAKTATLLAANRGYQSLINRNPRMIEKMINKADVKAITNQAAKQITEVAQ